MSSIDQDRGADKEPDQEATHIGGGQRKDSNSRAQNRYGDSNQRFEGTVKLSRT